MAEHGLMMVVVVVVVMQVGHVHHPAQSGLLWSLHEQQHRQVLEEDYSHPVRHLVGARSAEVPVDDNHGGQDGNAVHEKSEQEVLGNQWKH